MLEAKETVYRAGYSPWYASLPIVLTQQVEET